MRFASTVSNLACSTIAALVVSCSAPNALALDIFTEDFSNNASNWANFNSGGVLTHHVTGGPDGGAYASGPRSFLNASMTPIALRARWDTLENPTIPGPAGDLWNSSGGAFHRNWIEDGIRRISAWVKHDIPVPVGFFVRAAGEGNSPGHIYVDGIASDPISWKLVPPDTWTQVNFDVGRYSQQLLSAEGATWDDVYELIGHLQFGAIRPAGYETNPTTFAIGIDKVTVSTPEPASIGLVALGIVALMARMRCRPARKRGCEA